jgi:hypothetical protein
MSTVKFSKKIEISNNSTDPNEFAFFNLLVKQMEMMSNKEEYRNSSGNPIKWSQEDFIPLLHGV